MKLTPKQIEQMVADYRSGAYTHAALGAKYKMSRTRAQEIIRAADPTFKKVNTKLPDDLEDEIVAKYQAGASYTKLAAEYKITPHTLQLAVRSRGVERPKVELSAETEAAIVEDFRTGAFSYRKLGEKYGVTDTVTQRVIRRRAPELLAKVKAVGGVKPSFDRYEAYRDYCTGRFSLEGLGHKYGVSPQVMRNALIRVDPQVTQRMREARAKGASSIKPIKHPG